MSKRLDYIDYAKGIGILLVILGHMNLITQSDDIVMKHIIRYIYSFHMPLFFLISGCNLDRKYKITAPEKEDICRSLRKLIIPYFVWSGIYIALKCILEFKSMTGFPTERVIASITFRGIAPLWFLAALFFAQIAYMLFRYKCKIPAYVIMISSGILTIFLSRIYNSAFKETHICIRYCLIFLFRLFPSVFFMACGALMNSLFLSENRKKLTAGVGIISAAVFVCLNIVLPNTVNMHLFEFKDAAVFCVTGAAGSAALLAICVYLPEGIRWLSAFGRRSFDLMVLHYPPIPTIKACNYIVLKLIKYGALHISIVFCSTIAVTYIMSVILEKLRKKNRSSNLLL